MCSLTSLNARVGSGADTLESRGGGSGGCSWGGGGDHTLFFTKGGGHTGSGAFVALVGAGGQERIPGGQVAVV